MSKSDRLIARENDRVIKADEERMAAEAELKRVQKKAEALEADKTALRDQCSRLTNENEQLKKAVADLQARIKQQETVYGVEKTSLQSERNAAQVEAKELHNQLNRLKNAIDGIAEPITLDQMQQAYKNATVTETPSAFEINYASSTATLLIPKYGLRQKTSDGQIVDLTDGKPYAALQAMYASWLPQKLYSGVDFVFLESSTKAGRYFVTTPRQAERVIMSFLSTELLAEKWQNAVFLQYEVGIKNDSRNESLLKELDGKPLMATFLLLDFPVVQSSSAVDPDQGSDYEMPKAGTANFSRLREQCYKDYVHQYFGR